MKYWLQTLLICAILVSSNLLAKAGDRSELPSFSTVEKAATEFFRQSRRGPTDLITRSEVKQVTKQLADVGWEIADSEEIIAAALPDSHVLVSTLRSNQGQKFMRKVSRYELIYDRLDRVSQVSGGQKMLRSLVKLPDGQRYAGMQTRGGVPDLLSLLPKSGSGKKRTISEYKEPTGSIYTPDDLVARLRESYAAAQ